MNVAFLQNQWFKDPENVRRMIEKAKDPEKLRTRLLTYALFAGCLTGRRIKKVFGENAPSMFRWENASKEYGGDSGCSFPPDFDHIQKVLDKEKPDIVIAFGGVASEALQRFEIKNLIITVHPAARGKVTIQRLEKAAKEYQEILGKLLST